MTISSNDQLWDTQVDWDWARNRAPEPAQWAVVTLEAPKRPALEWFFIALIPTAGALGIVAFLYFLKEVL